MSAHVLSSIESNGMSYLTPLCGETVENVAASTYSEELDCWFGLQFVCFFNVKTFFFFVCPSPFSPWKVVWTFSAHQATRWSCAHDNCAWSVIWRWRQSYTIGLYTEINEMIVLRSKMLVTVRCTCTVELAGQLSFLMMCLYLIKVSFSMHTVL